jgi:hypothetical protein
MGFMGQVFKLWDKMGQFIKKWDLWDLWDGWEDCAFLKAPSVVQGGMDEDLFRGSEGKFQIFCKQNPAFTLR